MTAWPLTIGFDGRALTSPAAGVRRYASELLRALARLSDEVNVVLLGGGAGAAPAPFRRVPEPWHPPTNAGWSVVGLPRAARAARVDVLHAPAYTGPFWSPVPVVLTIHDVSYARHPEWFPYRRDAVRRAYYRRCALSADAILTDSAFSAAEIQAAYGIAAQRITVAPLGVDATAVARDAVGALPAGVTAPYVLHVGDLHERRNLGMLARAVREVRARHAALASLSLVLAGVDHGVGGALGADVVRLGRVDEPELHALYAHASALVYPSRYEGFGLPLLEAMAWGVPVIASRAASIPEVVGDAAVLLDPLDAAAWAEAIARVTSDRALHDRLRIAGLRRAAGATWDRTARITLDVYRQAARA